MINVAIIGVGKQGFKYTKLINEDNINNFKLVSLVRIKDEYLKELNLNNCNVYTNINDLLNDLDNNKIKIDLFIITTPHIYHKDYAIEAFKRGISVIVEKPVATTIKDVRILNETYLKYKFVYPDLKFSVIYQKRLSNYINYIKNIIDNKTLGHIVRINYTSSYFRPKAYYKNSKWLASWLNEQGGLLINQGIHDLDLIYYLFGMPNNIYGKTYTKYHDIECEDTVSSIMYYDNFELSFYSSTSNPALTNRLEIVFENGSIIKTDDSIILAKLDNNINDYLEEKNNLFIKPNIKYETIELDKDTNLYIKYFNNYSNNILIDGLSCINSILIMSSIYLSSEYNKVIKIPTTNGELIEFEEAYNKFINSKINK